MKSLLAFLLFFSLAASAQKNKYDEKLVDTKSYGYVNGVRLDVIDAKYGQLEILPAQQVFSGDLIKRVAFDYGQKWDKEKEVRVSNEAGQVITFQSTAAVLNFFDYNGWELVEIYNEGTGKQMILFRKRQKTEAPYCHFLPFKGAIWHLISKYLKMEQKL